MKTWPKIEMQSAEYVFPAFCSSNTLFFFAFCEHSVALFRLAFVRHYARMFAFFTSSPFTEYFKSFLSSFQMPDRLHVQDYHSDG